MTVEAWLILTGGVAQAMGVVCVGLVLRARSRRHGYTVESFAEWLRERLLARPDGPARSTVYGAATGIYKTAQIGWFGHAPILLPDPTDDPPGFRQAVAEELNKLSIAEKHLRHDVDDGSARLDKITGRVSDEIAAGLDRLRAEQRRDVVTVMHLDIIGFVLLLAGILASMVGGLLAL